MKTQEPQRYVDKGNNTHSYICMILPSYQTPFSQTTQAVDNGDYLKQLKLLIIGYCNSMNLSNLATKYDISKTMTTICVDFLYLAFTLEVVIGTIRIQDKKKPGSNHQHTNEHKDLCEKLKLEKITNKKNKISLC